MLFLKSLYPVEFAEEEQLPTAKWPAGASQCRLLPVQDIVAADLPESRAETLFEGQQGYLRSAAAIAAFEHIVTMKLQKKPDYLVAYIFAVSNQHLLIQLLQVASAAQEEMLPAVQVGQVEEPQLALRKQWEVFLEEAGCQSCW